MNLSGKQILIVDDTAGNIQVLGSLLSDADYCISIARDGVQAVEIAQSVLPDLILLDVMMPVMDGYEACSRLKEIDATSRIPIIFLSARTGTDDIVKGLAAGGVDYISKPFNEAELLQRVFIHLSIAELENQLKSRIEEAERTSIKIERMARENESFVRHELNNAISPVVGYTDMLLQNPSVSEEKRIRWLERVKTSADSILSLLGAVRDLHEVERGRHEMKKEAVNLYDLIREDLKAIELTFQKKNLFKFEKPVDPILIAGDRVYLQGVFTNLLNNAVEHVIGLSREERRLLLKFKKSTSSVRVDIHNGGTPVPVQILDTFFDKFNSTKRDSGGTGLGTSYALIVVEAHGGKIGVTSTEEQGTIVSVELPLSPSQ